MVICIWRKAITVICRCLKYIAVLLPALHGGIMEMVCLIWGDFLFLILQTNFRRALSNTGVSRLGIDHKKTASKALGCVGNGIYEVLVVPNKCTKLLKHLYNILCFAVCTEYVVLNSQRKAVCNCEVLPAGLAFIAIQ